MTDIVKLDKVASKIVELRNMRTILDSDVAELYGVETRDINKAVKNNPDKFPNGYLIELTIDEKNELVENFHRFNRLKHSTVTPKAFTEKGLYMLATILKSKIATATTISIVETFSQVREVSRSIVELIKSPEDETKQKTLLQKTGEMISKIVAPSDDDLEITETETTYKFNFLSTLEFSKKTKRTKKAK